MGADFWGGWADTQCRVDLKGIRPHWAVPWTVRWAQSTRLRVTPRAAVGRGPLRSQSWPRSPWALLPGEVLPGLLYKDRTPHNGHSSARMRFQGTRGLC